MPTSRQHLEACLTKLRAAGLPPPRIASTAEGYQLMLALWHEKLSWADHRAVAKAFDLWIDEHGEWPTPNRLLPIVRERQQLIENPPPPAPPPGRRSENIVPFGQPLSTPDDIRETCKFVEEVRGSPERFIAAPTVVEIGEFLIARHIVAGRAPPDVITFYGHLVDRYPELSPQAVAAE